MSATKSAKPSASKPVPAKKTGVVAARTAKVRQGVKKVPGARHVQRQVGGFVDFLRTQTVVGLAVGLVIGTQIKQLVDSLVNSFINPLVALVMPGTGDLGDKTFSITGLGGKVQVFYWGAFAATIISFVIVAAVIYFGIKALKLDKLDKKEG